MSGGVELVIGKLSYHLSSLIIPSLSQVLFITCYLRSLFGGRQADSKSLSRGKGFRERVT